MDTNEQSVNECDQGEMCTLHNEPNSCLSLTQPPINTTKLDAFQFNLGFTGAVNDIIEESSICATEAPNVNHTTSTIFTDKDNNHNLPHQQLIFMQKTSSQPAPFVANTAVFAYKIDGLGETHYSGLPLPTSLSEEDRSRINHQTDAMYSHRAGANDIDCNDTICDSRQDNTAAQLFTLPASSQIDSTTSPLVSQRRNLHVKRPRLNQSEQHHDGSDGGVVLLGVGPLLQLTQLDPLPPLSSFHIPQTQFQPQSNDHDEAEIETGVRKRGIDQVANEVSFSQTKVQATEQSLHGEPTLSPITTHPISVSPTDPNPIKVARSQAGQQQKRSNHIVQSTMADTSCDSLIKGGKDDGKDNIDEDGGSPKRKQRSNRDEAITTHYQPDKPSASSNNQGVTSNPSTSQSKPTSTPNTTSGAGKNRGKVAAVPHHHHHHHHVDVEKSTPAPQAPINRSNPSKAASSSSSSSKTGSSRSKNGKVEYTPRTTKQNESSDQSAQTMSMDENLTHTDPTTANGQNADPRLVVPTIPTTHLFRMNLSMEDRSKQSIFWTLLYSKITFISPDFILFHKKESFLTNRPDGYSYYCHVCESACYDPLIHATHHENYFTSLMRRVLSGSETGLLKLRPTSYKPQPKTNLCQENNRDGYGNDSQDNDPGNDVVNNEGLIDNFFTRIGMDVVDIEPFLTRFDSYQSLLSPLYPATTSDLSLLPDNLINTDAPSSRDDSNHQHHSRSKPSTPPKHHIADTHRTQNSIPSAAQQGLVNEEPDSVVDSCTPVFTSGGRNFNYGSSSSATTTTTITSQPLQNSIQPLPVQTLTISTKLAQTSITTTSSLSSFSSLPVPILSGKQPDPHSTKPDLPAIRQQPSSSTQSALSVENSYCDLCGIRSKTASAFSNHLTSHSHRRMVLRKTKMGERVLVSCSNSALTFHIRKPQYGIDEFHNGKQQHHWNGYELSPSGDRVDPFHPTPTLHAGDQLTLLDINANSENMTSTGKQSLSSKPSPPTQSSTLLSSSAFPSVLTPFLSSSSAPVPPNATASVHLRGLSKFVSSTLLTESSHVALVTHNPTVRQYRLGSFEGHVAMPPPTQAKLDRMGIPFVLYYICMKFLWVLGLDWPVLPYIEDIDQDFEDIYDQRGGYIGYDQYGIKIGAGGKQTKSSAKKKEPKTSSSHVQKQVATTRSARLAMNDSIDNYDSLYYMPLDRTSSKVLSTSTIPRTPTPHATYELNCPQVLDSTRSPGALLPGKRDLIQRLQESTSPIDDIDLATSSTTTTTTTTPQALQHLTHPMATNPHSLYPQPTQQFKGLFATHTLNPTYLGPQVQTLSQLNSANGTTIQLNQLYSGYQAQSSSFNNLSTQPPQPHYQQSQHFRVKLGQSQIPQSLHVSKNNINYLHNNTTNNNTTNNNTTNNNNNNNHILNNNSSHSQPNRNQFITLGSSSASGLIASHPLLNNNNANGNNNVHTNTTNNNNNTSFITSTFNPNALNVSSNFIVHHRNITSSSTSRATSTTTALLPSMTTQPHLGHNNHLQINTNFTNDPPLHLNTRVLSSNNNSTSPQLLPRLQSNLSTHALPQLSTHFSTHPSLQLSTNSSTGLASIATVPLFGKPYTGPSTTTTSSNPPQQLPMSLSAHQNISNLSGRQQQQQQPPQLSIMTRPSQLLQGPLIFPHHNNVSNPNQSQTSQHHSNNSSTAQTLNLQLTGSGLPRLGPS